MSGARKDWTNAGLGLAILLGLAFGRGWGGGDKALAKGQAALRLAYFPNLTHAPALVGVAGRYAQSLPGVAIQSRVVNAGPEAMEALLAGEVDMAFVGPSPATNAFLKTGGKALTIVAGACSGGASLMARGDAPIAAVRDLGGRRVAVPQLGGTQDVSLRRFLAQSGLAPQDKGGTVAVIPMANADILVQFKRGALDAAWVPEPWAARLAAEAGARTAVDERRLWPGGRFTTTVLVARRAFEEAHPDLVRAFVRAHAETVAWMGAHPDEAQKAANDELKALSGKSLKGPVLRAAWSHLTFTTDPDPASVRAFAEAAKAAGYLKVDRLDLTGLIAPGADR